jgi:hypothetical protein
MTATKKKCVVGVNFCDSCPHFDNKYYTFSSECNLLGRRIPASEKDDYKFPIPEDCPLPDWKEND